MINARARSRSKTAKLRKMEGVIKKEKRKSINVKFVNVTGKVRCPLFTLPEPNESRSYSCVFECLPKT